MRLLLVSNSTLHGQGYLDHCAEDIRSFFGPARRIGFVPFALADRDGYTAKAAARFALLGYELIGLHGSDGHEQLARCEGVFIGGGNTFRLLNALYQSGLLEAIRARARAGMPYMGSSAGTNVATRSIQTTNDMPIVQPPSFCALELVPFNINPHYLDPDPGSRHMGETREQRIAEFHEVESVPVLGLREGALLRVEGTAMELRGSTGARLFRRGQAPCELVPPQRVEALLVGSA